MVGELVHKPEYERKSKSSLIRTTTGLTVAARAYAVMPFVWSIGTIIGPAIGGTLAKPAESMPSVFSPDGIFAAFPYLLPNLICAALLLISILAGYFLLVETHPDMQPWSTPDELEHTDAETPLMMTSGGMANDGADLRGESYGTFNNIEIDEEKQWTVNADGSSRPPSVSSKDESKVFTRKVVMIVIALGIFTYHSMTYDHLLPIFLQDERNGDISTLASSVLNIPGGIGLSTQSVGIIMSINGLIALFIQAVVFPLFASWLGLWKLFVMVTLLHPLEYFVVPFLAVLPEDSLYPGIWACLTLRNFTSILAYPVLLILLKEASPKPSVLGKINGLAASAGAACRTIAPPVSGYLYGVGAHIGFTGLAWWGSALVAVVGVVQMFWIDRTKNKTATVTSSVTPCLAPIADRRNVVHIMVEDVDDTTSNDANEHEANRGAREHTTEQV